MPQAASSPPERRAVVVIDDDRAVLNSLKFALEIEGFAVRTYRSGEEFLAGASLPQSACLVLDYHLPGANGIAVVDELRRRRINVPAILITSNPPSALRQRAAAAGLALVEKPLLGNTLSEAIHLALEPSSH
jgi:FixJ family two-component response regulator